MQNEKEKNIIGEQIKKSFQDQIWWLKIRNLVVRIVAASFYLTKSSHVNNAVENNISNGEKRSMADILSDLIASMKDTVTSIDKENMVSEIFPVQAPGPSRLLKYLQDGHIDTLIALSKLVLYVHGLIDGSTIDTSESKYNFEIVNDVRNHYQVSLKRIQELSAKVSSHENLNPTRIKSFIEDLANTVEILSLGTLFVNFCEVILKPARSSLMRKGKKKKETIPQITQKTFLEFTNLINDMESVGNSLQDLLNDFDTSLLASSLRVMSLADGDSCLQSQDIVHQVINKVQDSYQNSIRELRELVQAKVKYLQSLKW